MAKKTLKTCKLPGCNNEFMGYNSAKYCSDECKKEARRFQNVKSQRTYKKRYKDILNPNKLGTSNFSPHRLPDESQEITEVKRELNLLTHYSKETYNNFGVQEDSSKWFTILYLKETNTKCPECGSTIRIIDEKRGEGTCGARNCGLVLTAPRLKIGFITDDLVPKRRFCPTNEELNISKSFEDATNIAYYAYWEHIQTIDPTMESKSIDPYREYYL